MPGLARRMIPRLGGLEARVLLASLPTVAAHIASASQPSGQARGADIALLRGVLHGLKVVGLTDYAAVQAHGRLDSLGRVRLSGRLNHFGGNTPATGHFTLATAHGSIRLDIPSFLYDGSNQFQFTFTVAGGTGTFRGASGSGSIKINHTDKEKFVRPPGIEEVAPITVEFH